MTWSSALVLVLFTACASSPRPVLLDNVIGRSGIPVGLNSPIRVLPDGRVFVSSEYGTQLWLLDANLGNARLVGDTANGFIPSSGHYIRPYLGDSSLLVRAGISDGFVLDGEGRKVRAVRPVIYPDDPATGGWPLGMTLAPFTADGEVMLVSQKARHPDAKVDSHYVVRTSFANPAGRDTVASLAREITSLTQFIPAGDGAALLSDGTIVILRAKGYRLEWIERSGARRSRQLAHSWAILTPRDKQEIVDSSRASRGPRTPPIEIAAIPDTVPAATWLAMFTADREDNLWIEKVIVGTNPHRPAQRGTFDIVDRTGRVVRRVVLPWGAVVKGFAPGRIYYVVRENGVNRLAVARTGIPR